MQEVYQQLLRQLTSPAYSHWRLRPAQLRFFLTPDLELGGTPAALVCRSEPLGPEVVRRKTPQFDCQLAR
jgi:hypothetical protein